MKDIREVLRNLCSIESSLPPWLRERVATDTLRVATLDDESIAVIAESYSSAAWDASSGAGILQSILSLVGNEVDETDQVKLLLDAYGLISQWMTAEVAEIGTAEDATSMFEAAEAAAGNPTLLEEMIKEEGGKFYVYSKDGSKKLGGPYATKAAAAKRLGQIEFFKKKESGEIPIVGDLIPLEEKAVRRDGTVAVKIIQPGWGTSGYYTPDVLERDGPKAFPAGTKMFWDHPTEAEEAERPERSLRDLAAVLVSPATYNKSGSAGEGLYADSQVFAPYRETINELAPFIGSSIRAWGRGHVGEAEGKKGQIIDGIVAGQSVDFVTAAGAGGQVLQLFEAARNRPATTSSQEDDVSDTELKEAQKLLEEAKAANVTALAEAARANEALALREARDVVAEAVSKVELHEATRARLVEQIVKAAPIKEGKLDAEALKKQVEEAVKGEVAYLATITGSGRVRDMGSPSGAGGADVKDADIVAAFQRLGLSESAAKQAAQGRE